MFDPLNLRNVEMVVYLQKRSHIRLLPQVKKWAYVMLQLNTTVGKLIKPSGSQSMDQNPKKVGEGSKNWSRRGDKNRSCRFSTLTLLVCL